MPISKSKILFPKIEEWADIISPEALQTAKKIAEEVQRMRNSGKDIYPEQDRIFRALELTSPKDVKVCIIGQDPYHTPGVANGLAFSVRQGQKLPPSLRNIFKELHDDIGCGIPQSGDLSKWAENGVLLLNTVLTVEKGKPNSHKDLGWQSFTRNIFDVCLNTLPQPVVFVLWGANAQQFAKDVQWNIYDNKTAIISAHPSPFSANRGFFGSRPFSKANAYLEARGVFPVCWRLC